MKAIKKILGEQPKEVRTRVPRVAAYSNAQPHWLVKKLDETLNITESDHLSAAEVFHPSALGNPCDRGLYLHFHGMLVEKIDAHTRRIFDNGNYLGYRYEKYFQRMGVWVASEVSVSNFSPPMRGRIDFHLKLPEAPRFVIELKSINDWGFQSLVRANTAKPEHQVQLQVYLNLFDSPLGGVLYENKNNQEVALFIVHRDQKEWQQITDRCIRVMNLEKLPLLSSVADIHDKKYCGCLNVADQ